MFEFYHDTCRSVFLCFNVRVQILYRESIYVSRMFSVFSSDKKLNKFQKQALIQATIHVLVFFCLLQRGFRIRGLTKKEILKLQLRHEMSISSQQHLQHELQKSASSHSFGLPHSHSFSGRIVFDQANSSIITNNEMVRFLLFQIIDLFDTTYLSINLNFQDIYLDNIP